MASHASSVNFQNLIRDLAEMYPYPVAEVVVVELVANSLDSGATRISIDYQEEGQILVVTDNGSGMTASHFEEYHDFAAGLKRRGQGIGFAGVGAKISFNIADRVITETRNSGFRAASDWYLKSSKSLVWDEVQPVHLLQNGTRVEVRFRGKPGYSSADDLISLLRRHYLPLFDRDFLELYELMGYYSKDLRFAINGSPVAPSSVVDDLSLNKVKTFFPQKSGKRSGYGVLGLAESAYPLGPDCAGVMFCTHGKVIKADFCNQFPGAFGTRIVGVVEIPALVDFLTTSKTDFMRGRKLRDFESLYGPVREQFKAWLADLGVQPVEISGTEDSGRIERELRKLMDDVPELAEFFGFRTRKTVLRDDEGGSPATVQEGSEATFPTGAGHRGAGPGPVDIGDRPGEALVASPDNGTRKANPISRTAPRGPKIAFSHVPERGDLAWVEGNTVFINSGHPAYVKVRYNPTANRVHSLFAIATAVQRFFAIEASTPDLGFVDRMMRSWGDR